jgi:hypothetical protein
MSASYREAVGFQHWFRRQTRRFGLNEAYHRLVFGARPGDPPVEPYRGEDHRVEQEAELERQRAAEAERQRERQRRAEAERQRELERMQAERQRQIDEEATAREAERQRELERQRATRKDEIQQMLDANENIQRRIQQLDAQSDTLDRRISEVKRQGTTSQPMMSNVLHQPAYARYPSDVRELDESFLAEQRRVAEEEMEMAEADHTIAWQHHQRKPLSVQLARRRNALRSQIRSLDTSAEDRDAAAMELERLNKQEQMLNIWRGSTDEDANHRAAVQDTLDIMASMFPDDGEVPTGDIDYDSLLRDLDMYADSDAAEERRQDEAAVKTEPALKQADAETLELERQRRRAKETTAQEAEWQRQRGFDDAEFQRLERQTRLSIHRAEWTTRDKSAQIDVLPPPPPLEAPGTAVDHYHVEDAASTPHHTFKVTYDDDDGNTRQIYVTIDDAQLGRIDFVAKLARVAVYSDADELARQIAVDVFVRQHFRENSNFTSRTNFAGDNSSNVAAFRVQPDPDATHIRVEWLWNIFLQRLLAVADGRYNDIQIPTRLTVDAIADVLLQYYAERQRRGIAPGVAARAGVQRALAALRDL